MTCEHNRLRCTNGVFYCLDCGAKVAPPSAEAKAETAEPHKRRAKKGAKAK